MVMAENVTGGQREIGGKDANSKILIRKNHENPKRVNENLKNSLDTSRGLLARVLVESYQG